MNVTKIFGFREHVIRGWSIVILLLRLLNLLAATTLPVDAVL
jgi:hypothetical protein